MSGVWALEGRFGPETWQSGPGRFLSVEAGGERLALPTDPLTAERLGLRTGACAHPGPFPAAFRFCPDCGQSLPAPALPRMALPWSPPFGAANGLPTVDLRQAPDPDSQIELELPPSPALGLAVAGTPAMLLACDRATGWVQGWSTTARRWIERVQLPGCALPGWSWSAAADATGLALPTDRGPAWIGLDRPRAAPVSTRDGLRCLGGAIGLRQYRLVPVQAPDGLAVAVLEPGGDWTMLPVADGPARSPEAFLAPVQAADSAIWCASTGQLGVKAAAGGLSARWRGWADGAVPLAGVRPVMERSGTLHQLARLDPTSLVLDGLALPGQVPERRPARGYTPGTGRAVFRENRLLRLPWDERELSDYVLPDQHFVLPLLCLGEGRFLLAVCTGRDRLGHFLGDPSASPPEPDSPPHACALHYSQGPRMLLPLDCVLRARHSWDLTAAIWGDALLVRSAVDNRCHRWRLVDA